MTQEVREKESMQTVSAFVTAMEAWDQASFQLMDYYNQLEQNVRFLAHELERKNAELSAKVAEIGETRAYINNILESISDGVIAVDLTGIVKTCNRSAVQMTGCPVTDLVGRRIDTMFMEKRLFSLGSGEKVVFNFTRSGIETELEQKDGEKLSVVLFSSPMCDENGQVIGAVLTFKDMTLIKKLEDEVARAGRLASIGEMAAGVAHEIRNPLGGIELFASTLNRDLDATDPRKQMMENILVGTRSINKIVSDLLNFTRSLQHTHFSSMNIIAVIEAALMFAQVEIEQHEATVVRQYDNDGSCLIYGDEDQLKQLFLNLFLNAAQAMPEKGGRLEVTVTVKDEAVSVEVVDNGRGIKKEHLSKIFDPFFTTKSKGNGLGLAISHRIVEAHRGRITVKSRVGQGSTFTLEFPLQR